MATVLQTPTFRPSLTLLTTAATSSNHPKTSRVSITSSRRKPSPLKSLRFPSIPSVRFVKLVPFAFDGDTEAPQVQEQPEVQVLDSSDGAVAVEDSTGDDEVSDAGEIPSSPLLVLLQSYKEALVNNDETKVAELESSLKSIDDEIAGLERKIASLSEELSIEKDRKLRIGADFDNYRKRNERDRLSLVTNAQGEVVESLLPVLDNFERAKAQIKVETEGEEKINNSYQSIYKQFIEILNSLGVEPVETVGNPFDPMLHEAIMREDSAEFEEGIILQEFRKGFKIGDRLLRPSMVKVSAGPGPAKLEQASQEEQVTNEISEDSKENDRNTETESA
ncbi:Co-chaperone GrpE family protein [Trifolium repens]|nr:Co-chaperone GrpE family protein [Trifolium repens]